ncbi:MAG: flagellar hook-basal body protein [Deltaproteobacteria bacterium]|nr:flagellar hook-basal body protein [Deltaproteobacteria bacterium]
MADITTIGTAMDLQVKQLEHLSNNLANAGTPGFKAVHLHILKSTEEIFTAEQPTAIPNILTVDFSCGVPQNTKNPLDLYINRDGFFVVETDRGEAYTKNGSFTLNQNNQLVTQDGWLVIGDSGPVTLMEGPINITRDGGILIDGNQVGQLKIVDFEDRQALVKAGASLYYDEGSANLKTVDQPDIQSGFLEMSNVNVVREMTDMIGLNRLFETYQKMIQALSEQDDLAVNRIGTLT